MSLIKKKYALYVLIGQEPWLLNDNAVQLKKMWRLHGETDEHVIDIHATGDWNGLIDDANSYSLFSEYCLLDARWDKKTIDAAGKAALTRYLSHPNPRTLILLRAPNLLKKQLDWLEKNDSVSIIQATTLAPPALSRWIKEQLSAYNVIYKSDIPHLIQQYTQGNMLACAQVIEKLAILHANESMIESSDVLIHLTDQCIYQTYELADACLAEQPAKAIHFLRQAAQDKREPSLILWLLTQEIRQLIQLSLLLQQSIPPSNACNKLKIWPKRAILYQKTACRLSIKALYRLLNHAQHLDMQIKSSQGARIWEGLEQLVLSIAGSR